jgi:hypothetical protein
MNLFNPAALSAKQIEHRNRIRAQGRKHYIFYTGILRWGMSVFALTTLWSWYEEYGWHIPPPGYLCFSIILGLVIWSVAGYFWGAYMWKRFLEESPRRMSTSRNSDGYGTYQELTPQSLVRGR